MEMGTDMERERRRERKRERKRERERETVVTGTHIFRKVKLHGHMYVSTGANPPKKRSRRGRQRKREGRQGIWFGFWIQEMNISKSSCIS
jgi:hypothetical protein